MHKVDQQIAKFVDSEYKKREIEEVSESKSILWDFYLEIRLFEI